MGVGDEVTGPGRLPPSVENSKNTGVNVLYCEKRTYADPTVQAQARMYAHARTRAHTQARTTDRPEKVTKKKC